MSFELLTTAELARRLRVSIPTLRKQLKLKNNPVGRITVGRVVRWEYPTVLINLRTRNNESASDEP